MKRGQQKNHTITIRVPPAAYLLLQAVAFNESEQTVEQWCEGAIAEAVRPILSGLASEHTPRLFDFFQPKEGA